MTNAAPIIFWQRIISPHMAALANALARQGREVHYCSEMSLSPDRRALGWPNAPAPGVNHHVIPQSLNALQQLIDGLPPDAVHLSQGLLRNGSIGAAQRLLRQTKARQWVMLEQVDDRGFGGLLKRIQYGFALGQARHWVERFLAIGAGTGHWLTARGLPQSLVSPFAYFLAPRPATSHPPSATFTILFVGRLVPLKRVDLLIAALSKVASSWRLSVIGDGPQARILQSFAARHEDMAGRVEWQGVVPHHQLADHYAAADLLVLPSDYDGWGAVASEALIAGCRVLVSDACGCASAVERAPHGRLFRAGSLGALEQALDELIGLGALSDRARRDGSAWARCLTADAGADYLSELLAGNRPPPPWDQAA